jgi:putative heme iron utilization protein
MFRPLVTPIECKSLETLESRTAVDVPSLARFAEWRDVWEDVREWGRVMMIKA